MPFVYVSGYRPEITVFRLDTAGGRLMPAGTATNVGQDPSFLAWDPSAKFLFAVNETDPGRVRSFAINQANGSLTPINDVPSMGSITAHLSTDKTGRWLLVANYGDNQAGRDCVGSHRTRRRLAPAGDTCEFGLGSMAHYSAAIHAIGSCSPVERRACGRAAGVRSRERRAQAKCAAANRRAAGAGPRHLDFHPNGRSLT